MPKAQGQHPEKRLTAVKVNSLRQPGRYTDGNGLYLEVADTGSKRWLVRCVVQGRRRDIGLGSARLVSLAQAREEALAIRKSARRGDDPVAERKRSQASSLSFEEAAERVHKEHQASWKNEKHVAQWINTLRTYVFPALGKKPIDQVQSADLLNVLSPIWLTKPETARRVRQRIGTVLDWARAAGLRDGENPTASILRGLPKQAAKLNHHAALPYADVPSFVGRLRSSNVGLVVRAAFEFLILTASRTSEVLGARWSEIDVASKLWVIPAERMKAGREHRVPLSKRCLAILTEMRALELDGEFTFPSSSRGKPLSNMTFLMVLRRMELPVTAHGFRSSFREWSSEVAHFPNEVAEMALAHTVENKVEAAYRRGDLLEKRREMMEAWSSFACPPLKT